MQYGAWSNGGISLKGINFADREGRVTKQDYFIDYYIRLKEIAINEFEWKNLPDTCDETFLELTLFEWGYSLFFLDPYLGVYFNQQCLLNSQPNMYYIPPKREAYSIDGKRWPCDYTNSVIIFNNRLRTPTELAIRNYAMELANIRQSININVSAMRTPKILKGNKMQVKELKKIYRKVEDGDPCIMEDNSTDINEVLDVLDMAAPEYYEKLEYEFAKLWRQALTYLGINNSPVDKKERLVDDEVNANNEEILSQRMSRLQSRKDACEKINKLFGLNLSVRFRERGGEDIGIVYNGIDRRNASLDGEGSVRKVPESSGTNQSE